MARHSRTGAPMCRVAPLALLIVLLTACGGPGEGPFPADYESRWEEARTPCTLSHDHELRYIRVFANDLAYAPYTSATGTYAPGAMLLKAEYDDATCTELLSYVLMEKLEPGASPPGEHDWTWRRFESDRSEVNDPRFIPSTCIDCHDFHCREAPYGLDFTCPEGAPEPPPP